MEIHRTWSSPSTTYWARSASPCSRPGAWPAPAPPAAASLSWAARTESRRRLAWGETALPSVRRCGSPSGWNEACGCPRCLRVRRPPARPPWSCPRRRPPLLPRARRPPRTDAAGGSSASSAGIGLRAPPTSRRLPPRRASPAGSCRRPPPSAGWAGAWRVPTRGSWNVLRHHLPPDDRPRSTRCGARLPLPRETRRGGWPRLSPPPRPPQGVGGASPKECPSP
mmetsp:Transcript_401/g.933  ORF Transcript_401/g.933 Transcript_401/m.933 type:complete len:224 (-) Transcript_401:1302-1973(-)